jgi:hypothetical protein
VARPVVPVFENNDLIRGTSIPLKSSRTVARAVLVNDQGLRGTFCRLETKIIATQVREIKHSSTTPPLFFHP